MMKIDDHDGEIFEDVEEEDEGYLFTGQGTCHNF